MPPKSPIRNENEDRLLPPAQKPSYGPIIGIIIILVLLIIGAFYFWSAHLNQQPNPENQAPFIPAENSTTTVQ